MNDRSATKGDACQSKKVKSSPDISLSSPRFQNEADCFARDTIQYSVETIAEMLGCSQQIASQNRLRFMWFFEDAHKLPAILAYHGQAYKHLKAETLNVDDLNYSQRKLWITSFLYGLFRPLDAILPYRMEGNVELPSGEGQNMFCFWKGRLTDLLIDAVEPNGGFVIEDGGKIVGYFGFMPSPELTYAKIYEGEWINYLLRHHLSVVRR